MIKQKRAYKKRAQVPIARTSAKVLSDKALQEIFELPEFVRQLAVTRSTKARAIIEIAETLKLLGKTDTGMPKSIVRSITDFYAEFGNFESAPHQKASFLKQLRNFGIAEPRVAAHENKVYVWKEDAVAV